MRIPSGVGGKFPTQKPAIDKVAEHIDDVVTVAESITSGQFDKVSVPEVKVVATSIKEVKQVAEVEQYVRMLAQDLSNIDLIGSQLAGVLNVSNNMAVVLLLHSCMADLLDIKKSLVHIDAVALNEERINSVYEIIPEIATLVSHMDSLVRMAQVLPQLEEVFKNLDAIFLIGSNIQHVVNVSVNMETILEASVYVNEIYTLIEQIKESEAHIVELEASSKVNAEEAAKQALEAKGYADSASASQVASAASQVAAKSSEDKAKASETASASSAAKALVSEGNAKKSEDAAKASELAAESDRAEVSAKSASVDAKHVEVVSKAAIVDTKTAQVIAAESVAVAAADTASQKAADAAGHEAVSLDAATRAENAALSMVGAIIDGGECDLSGGVYPQPVSAAGITYSTVWFVAVGGTVGGVTYDAGDQLRYTTANSGYYFKVDAKDEVYSVNGEKGAVTVSPEKIGAEKTGVAQTLVDQHASKTGAHGISGVQGLTEALAGKETAGAAASAITAHEAKAGAHTIEGVAGLREELEHIKSAGGDAVLDVKWLATRSPMRTGYAAGDGQTLSRALYPDAFAAIQAGLVPVCTDAEWLADPAKRGCFTLGDGSTTFRVPDYNGVYSGSYGPVYLGGGMTDGGTILRDRIQNITGTVSGISESFAVSGSGTGAFTKSATTPSALSTPMTTDASNAGTLYFDASRVARTGDTTRPITGEGCLAIKLFGAVQNASSATAVASAAASAELASRVSLLEQRKSTCLVNAVGTGAPHETVISELPATVGTKTRLVLPNPFGNNTPVEVEVQVFLNGKWGVTGFIYSDSGLGFGVTGGCVQGEGIIVQTGAWTTSASGINGGVHGYNGAATTTPLPVRVFVRKLEA